MGREAIATPGRILDAAYARFAQYGFRRTSMEDIASQAGVSRAALYLQFRNKEEIFRRLSERLQEEALARASEAAVSDLPLAERLLATVEAKTLRFVEIMVGSPHGGELLDETNRSCGDIASEAQERFIDLLTRLFRRAAQAGEIDPGRLGLGPAQTARLFHWSIHGQKAPGVTVEGYRANLAALVRLFVAGLSVPSVRAKPSAAKRRPRASARRAAQR